MCRVAGLSSCRRVKQFHAIASTLAKMYLSCVTTVTHVAHVLEQAPEIYSIIKLCPNTVYKDHIFGYRSCKNVASKCLYRLRVAAVLRDSSLQPICQ
ncbi:hypothetical protein FKM82_011620 [Ascaphus truei]